jgi:hypothetical protein
LPLVLFFAGTKEYQKGGDTSHHLKRNMNKKVTITMQVLILLVLIH